MELWFLQRQRAAGAQFSWSNLTGIPSTERAKKAQNGIVTGPFLVYFSFLERYWAWARVYVNKAK
jgi:hypothetical protein